ncbi:MAG: dihydrofolate reductase [Pseudomonadota bacterium]
MKVALVAAVADNGVIGRNNALPWRLSEDLKHFKRITMGKPVLMGRRTWESIGRPLPGRSNIVITRQAGYAADGAKVVNSLEAAMTLAEGIAVIDGADEVMVIGGAEIYALALLSAERLYLTEVHAMVDGDAFFPAWDRAAWQEANRQSFAAGEGADYPYSFVTYEPTPAQ